MDWSTVDSTQWMGLPSVWRWIGTSTLTSYVVPTFSQASDAVHVFGANYRIYAFCAYQHPVHRVHATIDAIATW